MGYVLPPPTRIKALLFALVRAFEFELAVPAQDIAATTTKIIQRPHVTTEPQKGSQLPLFIKPYILLEGDSDVIQRTWTDRYWQLHIARQILSFDCTISCNCAWIISLDMIDRMGKDSGYCPTHGHVIVFGTKKRMRNHKFIRSTGYRGKNRLHGWWPLDYAGAPNWKLYPVLLESGDMTAAVSTPQNLNSIFHY